MLRYLGGLYSLRLPEGLVSAPSTFKAGLPSDYTLGEVSDKYIQEDKTAEKEKDRQQKNHA